MISVSDELYSGTAKPESGGTQPSYDTITATNNTGSSSTSGDKVWIEKVGSSYNLIKSKKRNYIVNGTLTIDDDNETVSGCSSTNFINQWVGLASLHPFKIYVKFTTPSSMPTDNTWWFKVFNNAEFIPFYLDPYAGKIVAFGRKEGASTWNIINNKEITTLTTSTTYKLMCEFTGSAYIWYQYNGSSWVELTRVTSSSNVGGSSIVVGKVDGTGTFGNGTIDLSETYLMVENEIVWKPYVSNLSEDNSTGYALENIASGASGNVKTVL